MQLTNSLLLATIAATTALAAPTPANVKSMALATVDWTIESFLRTCTDTSCDISFSVNFVTATTPCSYSVTGNPADDASYSNIKCGVFTISSGWSDQFGAGNGFTTLAVTDGINIVYPAYTDTQLASGQVVTPDQSYPVQALP